LNPSRIVLAFLIFLSCYAQADDYSITNSLEALNLPKIDLQKKPFPKVISQLNESLTKNNFPEITVDHTLPKISVSTNASAFASAANAHIRQFLQEFSSQTHTSYF